MASGDLSMVDYGITYIFWLAVLVVGLKVLRDSINK